MVYSKLLFITYLSVICLFCAAQQNYNFSNFTSANGPVSSEISTLFQDSKNYLWIGHSAGISKYDGNRFENFLFASEHQLGKAYVITEDKHGYIWIGTEQGLFLWHRSQLHFIETGKNSRPVYALHPDKKGGIWIGNSDGPFYIPEKDLKMAASFYHLDLPKFHLPAWQLHFSKLNLVKFISVASDNTVYFGDGYEVYHYHQNKIIPIWESAGRFDYLTGIWAKNKDTVFICSLSRGIQVLENGNYRKQKQGPYYSKQMQEKNGTFFILTSDGVYNLDPVTLQFKKEIQLPDFLKTWSNCFMKDQEQNFWIGSTGQLSYANKDFFTILPLKNSKETGDFYSIYQLRNHDLLFGSSKGESFKISSGDKFLKNWKSIFPHAPLTGFHQMRDGKIWVSSGYNGLALLEHGKIRRFTRDNGLRDNTNFFFLENNKHELFTGGDAGVTQIIDPGNGKMRFKNFEYHTGSADYIVIQSGVATKNDHLFFGSNRGLFELKNDSLQPINIINANHQKHNITDLQIDADQNIWISTLGDGILLCAYRNGEIVLKSKLTPKEGLTTKIILQLLIDHEKHIWAAGYNDIFRIQKKLPGVYSISSYEKNQQWFAAPYYGLKMLQAVDGKIWVATTSGVLNFDPEKVNQGTRPVLNLTEAITYNDNKIIDTLNLQSGNTSLHSVNAINLYYKGVYFSNPAAVRYSYRLLGADSQWVDAGQSQLASFKNLQPGNYSFQVKASAGANQWSDIKSFDFIINSPFWRSSWFVVAASILFTLLLYLLVVNWEKRIQNQADTKLKKQQLIADNLQYRLETEKIINYFALSISEKHTEDEIVWDVVKNCIAQLGFEDCIIYLKDSTRNVLIQKAAWGPKTNQKNIIVNPIEIPIGKGIVGSVALNKKAEIVNDVTLDSRYIVDDVQRNSEIAVPILEDGILLGVIDSENSNKNFYSPRHLQILTTIASLCADKITIIKTLGEKRKAEMEALKNKQKATEARLQSMRLQMNPHFLFNALNSIQQMILSGDENIATRCLSKFSRLLRMVLIQSDKEKISLSTELEMLELYIELESFRFKDKFEFTIHCDESVDKEETQIPTLLIQPFVENAIWHGLMHKEGVRKLHIDFKETNNLIVCTIDDNGIGRLASQHLKQDSLAENIHTGKAISLATERLKIFDEFSQNKCSLDIIDKEDEYANAAGTKIIIKFPA